MIFKILFSPLLEYEFNEFYPKTCFRQRHDLANGLCLRQFKSPMPLGTGIALNAVINDIFAPSHEK